MPTLFELGADVEDGIKAAVQAELRTMFTMLPVIVSSSDQHITKANSAINGLVRNSDGTMEYVPLPEFDTMPVHFAGGGLMVQTHPIHANDEGLIVFAARAIDSWWQSGGQQTPIDARQHHASDGVYLGTIKSNPNKIPNKQPDSIQHRSIDAKVTHDVDPSNGVTTKVVPASDPSTNPFISATTFYQTIHNAVSGLIHSAVASGTTHLASLTHAAGHLISVANAAHTVNVHPSNGIISNTSANITSTAQQNISHTATSGNVNITSANGSILQTAAQEIALNAPTVAIPAGALDGLALGGGTVSAASMVAGAASSNIGALGGDLSGTLPDPNVVGCHNIANANTLTNAVNDTAAATAGVAIGKLYRNGSVLMVRVT